jgi:ribosomal protein S18 acetylase RimI-like enzyme
VTPTHDIRLIAGADVEAIAASQARAFYDDPLQRWVLPDDTTRLAVLERLFRTFTRVLCIPLGASYTDSTCSVAALWVPPGRFGEPPPPDAFEELQEMEESVPAAAARRMRLANDTMRAVHPHEPHWYLQGLGTDPPRQGQGLGTAALAPVLARADADGVVCYLESTKEANVAFYERHGFAVTGVIRPPDHGPRMWTMWREPEPA